MPNLIKNELAIELFWIISKVFSEYIANDTKAFKMFVANRAQVIQENNGANEWRYIGTKDSPAHNVLLASGWSTQTRAFIHHCVGEQKLAELPFDRLHKESHFVCCGVDLCVPLKIKG